MSEFFTQKELILFDKIDRAIKKNIIDKISYDKGRENDVYFLHSLEQYERFVSNNILHVLKLFGYHQVHSNILSFLKFKYLFSSHVCYKKNKDRKSLTKEDFITTRLGVIYTPGAVYAAIFFRMPFSSKLGKFIYGSWVENNGFKYVVREGQKSSDISWIFVDGMYFRNKSLLSRYLEPINNGEDFIPFTIFGEDEIEILYNYTPDKYKKAAILKLGRSLKKLVNKTFDFEEFSAKLLSVTNSGKTFKFKFELLGQQHNFDVSLNSRRLKYSITRSHDFLKFINLINLEELNFIIDVV